MREFILCSASPRRRELFGNIVENFKISVPNIKEVPDPNATTPGEIVMSLARQKAQSMVGQFEKEILVCADTMVFLDNQAMGKPKDRLDAAHMLRQLSGRTHTVCTGLAVVDAEKDSIQTDWERTDVTFAPMSDGEIQEDVATGEPMDKAGGYGIQGFASKFVVGIEGCYFNVVGLPIHKLYQMLRPYL